MSQDLTENSYMCPNCHKWFDGEVASANQALTMSIMRTSSMSRVRQFLSCPECHRAIFIPDVINATREARAHPVEAEAETPSAPVKGQGAAGTDKAEARAPRSRWKFWA